MRREGFGRALKRLDLRNSSNVIVGNGATQNINVWRDPATRILIVVTSLVVMLVVVVSIQARPTPRAALELVKAAFDSEAKVDADFFAPNGVRYERGQISAATIDITLKNNGDAPAVVTGVSVDVLLFEDLEDCRRTGGPVNVSASYTINLPTPIPNAPFSVSRDVRFEVRGNTSDRFTLTVGPDEDRVGDFLSPRLIAFDVRLLHDASDGGILDVGTFATLINPGAGFYNVYGSDGEDCVGRNAALVDRALGIQAVRSGELLYMRDEYSKMLAPDDSPAERSCVDWGDPWLLMACSKYTRDNLELEFTLGEDPVSDRTLIVAKIDTGGPEDFRAISSYRIYPKPESVTPKWFGSYLSRDEDDPLSHTRSDNAQYVDETRTLTVSIPVPTYFYFRELKFSLELIMLTGSKSYTILSSLPSGNYLHVRRGY